MIKFIVDVFKLAFDPKYYGQVMNELDQEYKKQQNIAEELKQFKKDLRDHKLGIKSFSRPSSWLEDLTTKDKK